jgi:hypothetical protein
MLALLVLRGVVDEWAASITVQPAAGMLWVRLDRCAEQAPWPVPAYLPSQQGVSLSKVLNSEHQIPCLSALASQWQQVRVFQGVCGCAGVVPK